MKGKSHAGAGDERYKDEKEIPWGAYTCYTFTSPVTHSHYKIFGKMKVHP